MWLLLNQPSTLTGRERPPHLVLWVQTSCAVSYTHLRLSGLDGARTGGDVGQRAAGRAHRADRGGVRSVSDSSGVIGRAGSQNRVGRSGRQRFGGSRR